VGVARTGCGPPVTLSDIAAQLVGVFGLYPLNLAWSSCFCDLPALCRRYRFRPLKMINLRLHAGEPWGRQPSDRLLLLAIGCGFRFNPAGCSEMKPAGILI
jgi:hypothetical protein